MLSFCLHRRQVSHKLSEHPVKMSPIGKSAGFGRLPDTAVFRQKHPPHAVAANRLYRHYKKGRGKNFHVFARHVLRYSGFYQRIKEVPEAVESHLIVKACEKSRKLDGECVPVHGNNL